MKFRIITTIVEEIDVQLKHYDRLEKMCNNANKVTQEWAKEVFENPSVTTTFEEVDIFIDDLRQENGVSRVDTFVKVQMPNGNVTWFEHRGNILENCFGGRMDLSTQDYRILKTTKADSMIDLDWSGTSFDDPDSNEGWLTPDGKYHGCSFGSHDVAARYMLKHEPHELRSSGHGKVYAKNLFTGKPFVVFDGEATEDQKKWMKARGIE